MATLQLGNNLGWSAKGGKNLNGGDDGMAGHGSANYITLAARRARLTAINGTYYTAARLDTLTDNDINYALRLADAPTTI